LGQTPAPEVCDRLSRYLGTLVVRVERQNASAARIATALQRHPAVRHVYYPGLGDNQARELIRRQMSGAGLIGL